nr:hypothetical protein Iba_chr10cCG8690 [Ipomoea batatas]GMD45505.1 hypothetical protein Iba_chr10dCG10700 [Ipomoea batatas]GMD48350.1 hypothetical protein Iba_chr10fCG5520 [Ipomoea batatas]
MPNLLTIFADPKVAAIPMNALNTLKLPMIDGKIPRCVKNAVIKLPGASTTLKYNNTQAMLAGRTGCWIYSAHPCLIASILIPTGIPDSGKDSLE